MTRISVIVTSCLALLALAGPGRAADGCSAGLENDKMASGLFAVIPEGATDTGPLQLACEDGQLHGVSIRLAAGESAQPEVLLVGSGAVSVRFESSRGGDSGWLRHRAVPFQGEGARVALHLQVPTSARPGERLSGTLVFETDKPGSGPTLLSVTIQVIDGGALFRDEFDVDPVMGQFSMVL